MEILFRNRWFAMIWGLLILGAAIGLASRSMESAPAPAAQPSEDPQAKFARWAAEEPAPAQEEAATNGRKNYEVRVYDNGRDVTSQVSDLPQNPAREPAFGEPGAQ